MPDGSRELSDSSHELPDGMEIDMSHYKEGLPLPNAYWE